MKKQTTLLPIILCAFLYSLTPSLLEARFEAKVLNLGSRTMVANGIFIGRESIKLVAHDCLKGSGLLQSPEITIIVGIFDFTGTIHCDEVCHIIAQQPFDEHMFKREGQGVFIITIESNSTNNKIAG